MKSTPEQVERQDAWFAALRDPNVGPQASGHLRTAEGRCCLGVAEDLAMEALPERTIKVWFDEDGLASYTDYTDCETGDVTDTHLTRSAMSYFGFRTRAGELFDADGADKIDSCVNANDGHSLSFPEIADWAEKNRERIFV